jgi:hypothetical protein
MDVEVTDAGEKVEAMALPTPFRRGIHGGHHGGTRRSFTTN